MILEFKVSNFKSFREEAVCSFLASNQKEFSSQLFDVGSFRVLPLVALFGGNASGKSNLFQAFVYLVKGLNKGEFESDPPYYGGEEKEGSSFELSLLGDLEGTKTIFTYGLRIGSKGVMQENLKTKKLGLRGYQGQCKTVFESAGPLSALPYLRDKEEVEVFLKIVNGMKRVDFSLYGSNLIERINQRDYKDKDSLEGLTCFLSSFDHSVIGCKYEKGSILIERSSELGPFSIPLENESSGTIKMVYLYPILKEALGNGDFLFLDELDSKLHPNLTRAILSLFADYERNPNKAQLFLTLHDSYQMGNGFLRRDGIYLVEKDEEGASSLYSLYDVRSKDGSYRLRNDVTLQKNYLQGNFGGAMEIEPFFLENI